jgi:hypothetical protein
MYTEDEYCVFWESNLAESYFYGKELVMTPRGKIGQGLKLLAPGLVGRMARNAIEKGR